MIIENANGKYFVPDKFAILDTTTGLYSLDSTKLVPFDLHQLQEESKLLASDIGNYPTNDTDWLSLLKGTSDVYKEYQALVAKKNDIDLQITNF